MEYREFCEEYNRMCKSVKREKCPIAMECEVDCTPAVCRMFVLDKPKKAERIVEQWRKENPPMRMVDKLDEIVCKAFGEEVDVVWGEDTNTVKIIASSPWVSPYKEPEK